MSDTNWINAKPDPRAEEWAKTYLDLAHPRLGSVVTFATDDFFAPKERLIEPAAPIFVPGKYDDHGKWMDGWESRRKRTPGHDWCVVKLGAPGRIHRIDIDTSFFTGNYPPEAMIEAWSRLETPDPQSDEGWEPFVPRMALKGDGHNLVEIEDIRVVRYLRLHIYPDGGVARLRVFGEIFKDWGAVDPNESVDLASQVNGGTALAWNDAHYGMPANMLAPGRGKNMGDGWETARRRGRGNDWAIIRLGHAGTVERVVVDTAHFKGNYPDRCALRAALLPADADLATVVTSSADWPVLLPDVKLGADQLHEFKSELKKVGPVNHARLDIFPDGGISRLRLFGKKTV